MANVSTFADSFPASFSIDFEHSTLGPYDDSQLQTDWPEVDWFGGLERASIVSDSVGAYEKCLKVFYPKGSVGPSEGGAQFVIPLEPAEQYTLSYDFKVSEDFDFRLGGKLPGLTSGGATYTGGQKPDKGQGWSARFMWRTHGEMVLYLYHVGMKGKWGDDHSLQMPTLERGQWYRVKQQIVLNDPDRKNGRIRVWVNGKEVLDLNNIELRKGNLGKIDSFYFSTFFGGNTREWGPTNDSFIRFDHFELVSGGVNT